jgi:hydrogenase maturation protein HypF
MLFGILSKILTEKKLIQLQLFNEKESTLYLKMLHNNFNIQNTTSTGRILDAVSALLGFCNERTYDGRPAMILESMATTPLHFEPIFSKEQGKTILMTTPLFEYLLESKQAKGRLAATAQLYIAKGLFEIAKKTVKNKGIPIVFSGGVAYNRMISDYKLAHGVLVNKELPAGDGCICYGQTYLANIRNEK